MYTLSGYWKTFELKMSHVLICELREKKPMPHWFRLDILVNCVCVFTEHLAHVDKYMRW